jgi:pyruvate dehydrogenase E1 component alpha subunit
MPRGKITPDTAIEHLSILGEDGEVDDGLMPDLSEDRLLAFHRAMLLSRRFDERLLNLQRQGRLGTFAPVKGQEAAQVGSAAALRDSDWVVPSYRETAVAVWRGTPLAGIFLFTAGYNEGGRIPDEQNDLPIAVPVGTQPLHAVGLGYGMRYRDDESVAMTYFGDGATSQGDFHEAMNFAAVFQTPVVFVCQNNQWAISVPRKRQTHAATLAQKALAYDMPGIQVDGNDILAVHVAATEAVERARSGGGPTLIECVTYRLEVHTTADDPTRYREDEEVEKWRARDPLPRFQKYLMQRELLTDGRIGELEEEIKAQIEDAWQEAEQQIEELRDPHVMFEHIYAEMPPHLQQQREELSRRQKEDRTKAA